MTRQFLWLLKRTGKGLLKMKLLRFFKRPRTGDGLTMDDFLPTKCTSNARSASTANA